MVLYANKAHRSQVSDTAPQEGFTAETAAKALGIPKRTFECIEQDRGFPYPLLLRIAMEGNALSLKAIQEKLSRKD
ncbi:XRE family transcriptional regulator [Mesorhizobium sp. B4-1-3]|nr:XRE family transcriptional regulator [Mesorhizobium sp. B4-1-3]